MRGRRRAPVAHAQDRQARARQRRQGEHLGREFPFAAAGLHDPLTATGYRGAAYSGVELANGANVQRLIRTTLCKMSDRLTAHSPLAASLMHIASSGTGRQTEEGSGDHRAPTMLED